MTCRQRQPPAALAEIEFLSLTPALAFAGCISCGGKHGILEAELLPLQLPDLGEGVHEVGKSQGGAVAARADVFSEVIPGGAPAFSVTEIREILDFFSLAMCNHLLNYLVFSLSIMLTEPGDTQA